MTAPVVESVVELSCGKAERLFHFACTLVRMAAYVGGGKPVRCLCGVVQTRSQPSGKEPRADLRCVVCADLAPAHLETCAPCRAVTL